MRKSTLAITTEFLLFSSCMCYAQDAQEFASQQDIKLETQANKDSPNVIPEKKSSLPQSPSPSQKDAPGYDYRLIGNVESVYYYSSSKCYIAVTDSREPARSNKFHSSITHQDACKFAERAKILGKRIILDAKIDGGSDVANNVVGVGFADTEARFW